MDKEESILKGQAFTKEALTSRKKGSFKVNKDYYPNINIGGQNAILPNWTNLEGNFNVWVTPEIFEYIPDKSVTSVFSSHFFEHITQRDAFLVFQQIKRILIPNGVFRITGPDIDLFAEQFTNEDVYIENWYNCVWPGRSFSADEAFIYMGGNPYNDGKCSPEVFHIWPQSTGVIFWMLTAAGFNPRRILKMPHGISLIPDVMKYGLDNRSNHSFRLETVNV